jgi:hypothetical protein
MNTAGIVYFDTEAGYGNAIDTVLASAQRHISIFDPDMAKMKLEDSLRVNSLTRFLSQSPLARLQVVVHDTRPLESRSPRLLNMFRRYPHAAEIRLTADDTRHLANCFLLADEGLAVVRFHAAHPRGKLVFGNTVETAAMQQRFMQLWALSSPSAVTSTLGL